MTIPFRALVPIEGPSIEAGAVARRELPLWLLFALLLVGLVLLALVTPISHDEDQYLGAAMLARNGVPFVDFIYLQTPLQPVLAAPLVGLWPGHGFLVLRLAGALLALVVLSATYAGARASGVSERGARMTLLFMATSHAFLFAAGLVRNDILPAALFSLALLAMIMALRGHRLGPLLWFAAGLCLGAATSTKVSYGLLGAGAALYLLMRLRAGGRPAWTAIASFAAGGCLGLVPILMAWLAAPEAFRYGVFTFANTAPFEWYQRNGHGFRTGLPGKIVDCLIATLMGPILPALLICAAAFRRRAKGEKTARFLDLMILCGLIAALLPTPTWRQYFMPLLPPLFIRLAMISVPRSRLVLGGILLTMAAGIAPLAVHLVRTAAGGAPVLNVEREAAWIGATARGRAGCGAVATLSPHLTVDSGLPLDRRFAAGPFFYRTGDRLPPDMILRLHGISPHMLAAELDRNPPAAIVTGYEDGSAIDRIRLDDDLVRYALSRGFAAFDSPVGDARLFVRPARPCTESPDRGVATRMKLMTKLRRTLGRHHPDSNLLVLFLLAAGGILIFMMLASEVREGEVFALDRWLIQGLRDPADPSIPVGPLWLRLALTDLTALGGTPLLTLLTILAVGYLLAARKAATAAFLIASLSAGAIFSTLLKLFFARARPDIVTHLVNTYSTSFPSGHAMNSAIVYLTLGALLARAEADRGLRVYLMSVAVFLTLIIGFSRIYLGVHWPSDVLAGWCVGAAWAILCSLLARALQRRHTLEPEG